MVISQRELTIAQSSKLDKLAEDARVIGWKDPPGPWGPIVRHPGGKWLYVNPHGRLVVLYHHDPTQ